MTIYNTCTLREIHNIFKVINVYQSQMSKYCIFIKQKILILLNIIYLDLCCLANIHLPKYLDFGLANLCHLHLQIIK